MTNVLFTLPALLLYCVFFIYPVLLGINYSFTDWNGIAKEYTYIGFQNYWNLFKNPFFWQSMRITLMYTLILVVGVMFLSLVLSLSLNSMKHFQTFTKSVFFVPAMIGGVTIALIFDQIYYRVIPVIGHALGISALSQSPLATTKTALIAIVAVNIWQATAMPTLIFMAGLQSVPGDLYESAMLDGASAWQRFRYITFPYLIPTFTINMVLTVKAGIVTFDYIWALTQGGPSRSTNVIGIMIYNDAFNNMKFSLANAESMVLFLIIAVLSAIQIKLSSKGGVDG
jgi:raffinose/stachyose/melibiose transport system permease protein